MISASPEAQCRLAQRKAMLLRRRHKLGLLTAFFLVCFFASWNIQYVLISTLNNISNRKQESSAKEINEGSSFKILQNIKQVDSSGSTHDRTVHVCEWDAEDFCLSGLYDVYWHPLFPTYPSRHYFKRSIEEASSVSHSAKSAIRRFLFLLCPPSTGSYQFSVYAQGGFDLFISEWTSSLGENDWKPIYHIDFKDVLTSKEANVTSEWNNLNSRGVYRINLVHATTVPGIVRLMWRTRSTETFRPISSRSMCGRYHREVNMELQHEFPLSPIVDERRKALRNPLYWFYTKEQRTLGDFHVNLSTCNYTPSYVIKHEVSIFSGWHRVKEGKVYPYYPLLTQDMASVLLANRTAKAVALQFWKVIKATGCRQCLLDQIVYVEENREAKKGRRYFVEIDVIDPEVNETIRISDYVYKKSSESSQLCFPKGYIWKSNVEVTVVFTTSLINKKWTLFLLDTISKILYATGDRNVKVLIAAYGMENVDLGFELQKRNLRGRAIHLPGKFNKVKALNLVMGFEHDPESIVFTVDLHLELPLHLFDQVRKNTIRGKTVFAPLLVRLGCGKHMEYTDPGGSFWIFDGFGMIGAYRADWEIIGGMNEELFGTKWGGEDWELIDRVVSRGYEVIRRRLSGFYHVYHSRKGAAWYGERHSNPSSKKTPASKA